MLPDLLADLPTTLRSLGRDIDAYLTGRNCDPYVKTIYVGYTLGTSMVAAVYPESDRLVIALAVDQPADGEFLIDATDLTWPTMPVAAVVRTETQLKRTLTLLDLAIDGVSKGEHTINRPPEFFRGRPGARRLRPRQ